MGKIYFNKLVRDKIPEILQNSGETFNMRLLDDQEYLKELDKILVEDANEYCKCNSIEKLADIVEVIKAILFQQNIGIDEFEIIRQNKYKEKGGFKLKIFLESIEEKQK